MDTILKVAIIGCGYWGANYVRLFTELPNTHIAMVCDRREDRLEDIHQRFGVPVTTDIEEVINNPHIDAAVICTNATTHFEIAYQLLKAGIHLLIEKPMVTRLSEAETLVELANTRNLTLMIGHIFLFNPGIETVKQYISESKIGSIYYLYARRTNLGPVRTDVNALWDLATHDIAIYNYLLDCEPDWVSAVGGNVLQSNRADVGFINLHYPNGVLGHIHVSWADPSKEREVVVVGSKLRIAFNDLDSVEKVRVYEKGIAAADVEVSNYGEYQLLIRDGDIISPSIQVREPLKHQAQHFLECIQNGKRPLSDGYSGLGVIACLEAIDQSMHAQGQPVYLRSREVING